MKRLVCIGDSITKGTYTALGETEPLSIANSNYASLLCEMLGFDEVINYGVNGIAYSGLSPVVPEGALTKNCNRFEVGDIMILAAGTNDFGTNVPLGDINDTTDCSFCGAVDQVFHCMSSKVEKGSLFVVLPIRRIGEMKNELGYPLDAYREVLAEKAKKYGLPVIDGRLLAIYPEKSEQRELYMPDGLHPNEAGHEKYAKLLYREIINYRHDLTKTYTFTFRGYEATVIVPEHPTGEWIWKTEFLYAFDQAERALYADGYTRVYYGVSDRYGSAHSIRDMHTFYWHVIQEYDLNPKCHLFGFSRGGLYAVNFALFYPELVKSIYLDAPVLDLKSWPPQDSVEQGQLFLEYSLNQATLATFSDNPVDNLKELFELKIPVLLIAGAKDSVVAFQDNAEKMIEYCREQKIALTSVVKPECDHHPHSLEDVSEIVAFVHRNS